MKNKKKDVQELIIKKAREIFALYGFRKTTVDDIARASRKAKSSIYHYFRSKEKIFQAVVEKEASILKAEIMNTIERESDPQKKLISYFIFRMKSLKRLANFYTSFKDEYFEHYKFIQKIRKEYDTFEIDTIKSILKEGVDKGIFVIKNIKMTAVTIVTAQKGMEYQWAVEEDLATIEKNIRSMANVLFYGILRR
jgi:AcrR family transcriptional regulator